MRLRTIGLRRTQRRMLKGRRYPGSARALGRLAPIGYEEVSESKRHSFRRQIETRSRQDDFEAIIHEAGVIRILQSNVVVSKPLPDRVRRMPVQLVACVSSGVPRAYQAPNLESGDRVVRSLQGDVCLVVSTGGIIEPDQHGESGCAVSDAANDAR